MKSALSRDTQMLELLGNIRREYCALLDSNLNFVYQNTAFKKLMAVYGVDEDQVSLKELFNQFEGETYTKHWQQALQKIDKDQRQIQFSYNLNLNQRKARIEAEAHAVYNGEELQFLAIGMDEVTDLYLMHRFEKLKSNFLVKAIKVDDEKELLWVLIDELLSKLYFEDALILKKEGDLLIPVAAFGNQRKDLRDVASIVKVPIDQGITGHVAKTGKSYLTGDCAEDPYYISRHFDAGSEVAVPIMVRGKIYGVINGESEQKHFFRSVHQELLEKAAEVLQHRIEELNSKAELQQLEQRHLAIINSTPNSFLLFDRAFQLMSFNTAAIKAWLHFTNVHLAEGQDHQEAIPPTLVETFLRLGNQALKGNHKQEYLAWDRESDTYQLKLNFAPAREASGAIFGFTMLVEDVTELYVANESLREKNINLELNNKELDQFVYSISHDLRAPLSSIMGLVNLIENSKHLPETKIYAKMLQDATESMDSYIRNILEYSRNKRFEIDLTEVEIPPVVEEMQHKFRFIPGYRELDFTTDYKIKKLISDPYRIEIILNNLITNAIKYRDIGKAKSWCKLRLAESDTWYEIEVSDNGIGIPTDKHAQLFEMFFKVKSEHPGSGLGLYILKEVVDSLKGRIEVASKEKKGTTFTVLLPKETLND